MFNDNAFYTYFIQIRGWAWQVGDEGNKKQQVALMHEVIGKLWDEWKCRQNTICCLVYLHLRLVYCRRMKTRLKLRDSARTYLALDLPGFGDGGKITSRHHHGPEHTTWLSLSGLSFFFFFFFYSCLCVQLNLHDNLFASGLKHHVFGPVVPVLVGLGLVHDLLEHGSLPAQKQTDLRNAEVTQEFDRANRSDAWPKMTIEAEIYTAQKIYSVGKIKGTNSVAS